MASDPSAKTGKTKLGRLGKYEIVAHIATGGMGAVYKARDTATGREVALKLINRKLSDNPAIRERFRREISYAAKLCHDNIVPLLDHGEQNGTRFFVMEFVDGIDLNEYVQRLGPLDPEEARQLVYQGA